MAIERKHRVPPVLLERARLMRHGAAPAEQKLWWCLRARRLDGLKFKRQHPVGPFVADFYCAEHRLVLEADGASHVDRTEYDEARTRWLNDHGYRVVRYENGDVHEHLDAVLEDILLQVEALPPLPPWGRGRG
jgi:very-short-patch-repair endonuclease